VAIALKRVYETPTTKDGYRLLVDRLWPRGVSKESARLDEWMKQVAPSDELRKWFHDDPSRWAEFRRRYLSELKVHRDELRQLARAKSERVTLVFSASDEAHNNAVVVKQYLRMLGAG
jgi:uncharacterized protein YeaO (DUF488 family)